MFNVFFKKLGEQDVVHMVAKETLFMDYIWTIGYYLTLQNDGSEEKMFPSFYDSIINEDNKSDSKVAAVFTRAFKSIRDLSKHYCDAGTMNEVESSIEEFYIKHLNTSDGFNTHGAKK